MFSLNDIIIIVDDIVDDIVDGIVDDIVII